MAGVTQLAKELEAELASVGTPPPSFSFLDDAIESAAQAASFPLEKERLDAFFPLPEVPLADPLFPDLPAEFTAALKASHSFLSCF